MAAELGGEHKGLRRPVDRCLLQPSEPFLSIAFLTGDRFLDRALFEVVAHLVPVTSSPVTHPTFNSRSLYSFSFLGVPPLLVLLFPPAAFGSLGTEISRVPVTVAPQSPTVTVDLDDRRGEGAQEGAVMGDGDDGTPVGGKLALKPADGVVVQVVCRFVQEQDGCRVGEQTGQGKPFLLTAGKGVEGAVPLQVTEPELAQRSIHP